MACHNWYYSLLKIIPSPHISVNVVVAHRNHYGTWGNEDYRRHPENPNPANLFTVLRHRRHLHQNADGINVIL